MAWLKVTLNGDSPALWQKPTRHLFFFQRLRASTGKAKTQENECSPVFAKPQETVQGCGADTVRVAEHEGLEIHHPADGSMGPQQVLEQSLCSTYLFIKSCFKMKWTSAVVFSSEIPAFGQHLKSFFLKTWPLKTPQRARQCCPFRCEKELTNDTLMKLL